MFELASGTGHIGEIHDFNSCNLVEIALNVEFVIPPIIGEQIDIYWSSNDNKADLDSITVPDDLLYIEHIGYCRAPPDSITPEQSLFQILNSCRYGRVVIWNGTCQTAKLEMIVIGRPASLV